MLWGFFMPDNIDLTYMQRAHELSLKGGGRVNPNPLVGAVLVRNGAIIGEGYHAFFGGPHAEVSAMEAAGGDVGGATLYVTLEPCNHQGKTPACTPRIIQGNIRRVVVGMKDPNPGVAGNGIAALEAAGIEVTFGTMNEEISRTNEFFTKYITTGLPFCTLKTAMTLDGKIATRTGDARWISSEPSRMVVHRLRNRHMAIMTGVGTVVRDNPALNDRSDLEPASHPLRIVVDSYGSTPPEAKVLDVSIAPTLEAVTDGAPADRITMLKEKGADVLVCPGSKGRVDLGCLMKELGARGIDSVLIEGGGSLGYSALQEGIVDKVIAFIAPKIAGGKEAPTPVEGEGIEKINEAIELDFRQVTRIGPDILVEAYMKR